MERRPLENQESGDPNFSGNACILEEPRVSEEVLLLAECVASMQDEQLVPALSVTVSCRASVNCWRESSGWVSATLRGSPSVESYSCVTFPGGDVNECLFSL